MRAWGAVVFLAGLVLAAAPHASAQLPRPERPSVESLESLPSLISLEAGEIRSVGVEELTRVAIGNPDVLDVTVVSSREILLQAKKAGTTNLIIWDQAGQHTSNVEVVDRAYAEMEEQLRQLVRELNLPGVSITREEGKIFLTGEVGKQTDLDRLEQMLSAYPGVTNLVTVPAAVARAEGAPGQLVKLSVQIIELNRTDTEKLGVDWTDSLSYTESTPSTAALDALESLWERLTKTFRFGTGSRNALTATINALVQRNRARILAEPKLVTASGKEASSFIGLEVPILQATTVSESSGSVSASIEFRNTGVLLKMTPIVLDDQTITTALEAEVSGIDTASGLSVPVGSKTIVVPGFKVRKAKTEITTASGETIFIAGLLELEDSEATSQVPALGGIPVLGRLFKSPEIQAKHRELIIAVTPELMTTEAATTDKTVAVEQALAVAEVTASVQDPTLRYALQIQERIAKAIRYPIREKELGMSGHVKLRLHLFRDGTLGRALVAESSGIDAFDLEALKIAEHQSPYPPFPSDLSQKDLWLELPVLFRP